MVTGRAVKPSDDSIVSVILIENAPEGPAARRTPIRTDVQKIRTPSVPWRLRVLNLLWFGRSVRTQILLVFIALNLVAASIAGGVIIFKAGASTRIEIAASMRLAELMANEAVQLVQHGIPAEQFLRTLPGQLRFLRHVRIGVRDAAGQPVSDQATERTEPMREDSHAAAPAWFAMLIGPAVERHEMAVVVGGGTIGTDDRHLVSLDRRRSEEHTSELQ